MNAIPPIDTARNNPINTVPRQTVPQLAETRTVQSGDTLSGIVREYLMANGRDHSARAIYDGVKLVAAANNLPNADRIFVGQKITVDIPGPRLPDSFTDTLETVASAKPETKASVGPPAFAQLLQGPATLSSPFGLRNHPISNELKNHNGIDLAAERSTPITPMSSGIVTFSGEQRGHGNTIIIQHRNGIQTRYSHVEESTVSVGDFVQDSTVVGYVGSTGNATGPHLHFEVKQYGNTVNPLPYLEPKTDNREKITYSM